MSLSLLQRVSPLNQQRNGMAMDRSSRSGKLIRAKGKILLIPKIPGKKSIKYPVEDPVTKWTIDSKRVGAIGIKAGMTQEWDNYGIRRPLTIIKLNSCEVVQVKKIPEQNFFALQVGCTDARPKHLARSQLGHFAASGVTPKRKLMEFRVTEDALMPPGTPITCRHFVAGQTLTIQGKSKGKGFQGVMKRWGFSGGAASHGNSLAHRTPGSTGARQDPGKVWKGKKMPGHMGNKLVQAINSRVYEIYPELDSFAVIGSIPGPVGGYLRIKDSLSNVFSEVPPFPTFEKPKDEKEVPTLIQYQFKNPFATSLPDLKEKYWERDFKDKEGVERLFNGKFVPQFAYNLKKSVEKIAIDVDRLKYLPKTSEIKKKADKARKLLQQEQQKLKL